ncbi:LamG-like jellyroll fold domain-containing protein [Halovenus marina]|uniref:LamG-like jellyroll fold domain-containing protein n=1 Tax=Halovenus marina TaxID=3396621 RepID=UPI003F56D790
MGAVSIDVTDSAAGDVAGSGELPEELGASTVQEVTDNSSQVDESSAAETTQEVASAGKSFETNGLGYGTISDGSSVDFISGGTETVEFWVKPDADSDDNAWIMRQAGSWGVQWTGTGEERQIRFKADGFNDGITSSGGVPADVWTHVAIVYDGNQANLYLNGKLDAQGGGDSPDENDNRIRFGSNDAANGQFFVGQIDNVRFWNTDRSLIEVRANLHEELDGSESGLAHLFQFDDDASDGPGTDLAGSLNIDLTGDATMVDRDSNPVAPHVHVTPLNSSAEVSLDPRPGATGGNTANEFHLYRSTSPDPSTASLVTTLQSSTTSYTDQAVTNGQTYYYWATTVDNDGEGDFSKAASVEPYGTTADSTEVGPDGGQGGDSLELNGLGSGTVSDRPSLGIGGGDDAELAVEFWVNPDADSDDNAWILRKQNAWGAQWTGTGEERQIWFKADGFHDGITSNDGVQAGVWTHVAIVYDENQANLYLDGELDKSISGVDSPSTSGNDLKIGTNDAGNDQFFVGQIDDLRFWNSSRTQSQVESNLTSELVGSETDLAGYWTFDTVESDGTRGSTFRHGKVTLTGDAEIDDGGAYPVGTDTYVQSRNANTTVSWSVRQETAPEEFAVWRKPVNGDETEWSLLDRIADSSARTYVDESSSNGQNYHYAVTTVDSDGQESDFARGAPARPYEEHGGSALSLDGSDDTHGEVTDRPSLGIGGGDNAELAVEFWVKPDADSDENAWILRKQNAWGAQWTGTGEERRIYFQADGFRDGITSNGGVPAGVWTHVAIVYDGNQANIYLNGELDKSTGADSPGTSGNDLKIGTNDAANDQFFAGQIDELALWDTTRTAEQVERTYNDRLRGNETGLNHYWQFDEQGAEASRSTARRHATVLLRGQAAIDSPGAMPVTPRVFARADNQSATVSWRVRNLAETTDVGLYRSTQRNLGDRTEIAIVDAVQDSRYTDPGLTNGETRFYQATAFNTDGQESDYAFEAGALPSEQTGGNAFQLLGNSSSSYGTLTDRASIDRAIGNEFALEFWVNPDADSEEDAWIFRKQNTWGVQWRGTGDQRKIRFQADGFNDWITSDSTIAADTWTHVAIVYDGSNRNIYLNGELDTTAGGSDGPGTTGNDLRIGTNGALNDQFFQGKLDEIRIWDEPRADSEVRRNYDNELAGSEDELVGYWRGPFTTGNETVTGNARKPMTIDLNNVGYADSGIPIQPGGVDTTTVNVTLACAPDGLTYYEARVNATSGEPIRSLESGPEFGGVSVLDGGPGVSSVTAAGEFSSAETTFSDSRVLFSVEYEGAVNASDVSLTVNSLRGGDGEITECAVTTDVSEPQSPDESDGDDGDGDETLDFGIELQQTATVSQGGTVNISAYPNNRANQSASGTLELRVDQNGDGQFGSGEVVDSKQVTYSADELREEVFTYDNVQLADGDYSYQARLISGGQTVTSFTNGTLTVSSEDDGTEAVVKRIAFDYYQSGGNLNLEVNGDRVYDINSFTQAPPDGVDGMTLGGASVTVTDRSSAFGERGTVEITGDITSFSVGGQEMPIDNIEFGPESNPDSNVTFDTLTPSQSEYTLGDTFTSNGVEMEIASFIYSDGTDCSTTQSCGSGSQTDNPSFTANNDTRPDFYPNNVNVEFNLSSAVDGTDDSDSSLSVERQVDTTVSPGDVVDVSITASVQEATDSFILLESLDPAVANATLDSVQVDGQSASLFGSSATTDRVDVILAETLDGTETVELTYSVEIPSDASIGSQYTINGNVTTDQGETTIGESVLEVSDGSPSISDYTNENGRVDTAGLRNAISDWRSGTIGTGLLRDVIGAWRSGDQIT